MTAMMTETNAEIAEQKFVALENTRAKLADLLDDLAGVGVEFDRHTGELLDWSQAAELSTETVSAIEAAHAQVIKVVADISGAVTALEEVQSLIGAAIAANKPAVEASDTIRSSNAGHQATAPASD